MKKKSVQEEEFQKDRMAAMIALAFQEAAAKLQDVSGQSMGEEPCPSPEDLSAFTSGLLEQDERDSIVAHLDRCEKCYKEVIEVFTAMDVHPGDSE